MNGENHTECKRGILNNIKGLIKNHNIDPFPIRHTLKDYTFSKAKRDFKAAVNVSLLDFPQGMAYALISGFPVQFGIYSSAISSITGPIFASSRFIMLGPTNATAVLLMSAMLTLNLPAGMSHIQVLPLFLLMVGAFTIIGAFAGFANIVQYVSKSVIIGYITVAALLIIVNQLKVILDIDIMREPSVFHVLYETITHIGEAHWQSILISGITLALYLLFKRYLNNLPVVAITLVTISFLTIGLKEWGHIYNIKMLAPINPGSWDITTPVIDLNLIGQLANVAIAISFLSILESSSISKTLAARSGDRVNINQQMLSVGLANVANAFTSGIPASGSLTRSALNWSSGAVTSISSIMSGMLLIAGVFIVGPYIEYIPKASLATLVIAVGISLINKEQILLCLKATKSDALTFLITFTGGLFLSLDTAIYLGAAASIMMFLKKASTPELVEIAFNESGELTELDDRLNKNVPEISIVHVEGDLFFGSTEVFLDQARLIVSDKNLRVIIFRLKNARHLDATSAQALGDLIHFAREQGRDIIVSGVRKEVVDIFYKTKLMDLLGKENFFEYNSVNPNISTRNALKRAQHLMGEKSANIIIYAKPEEKE